MKEIAAFEAGIKLGALFHQFIGIPISPENVELIERAMESCVRLQPFVVHVEVKIDREKLKEKISEFGYCSLSGEMIYARVRTKVDGAEAEAVLEWDEEKKYPLMKLIR